MEDTRNVYLSQEEAERYEEALGTLLAMQQILRDVRRGMGQMRRVMSPVSQGQKEKIERIERERFIRSCDEAEINAMPYVKGVTIHRATNTIKSEIRSFRYALNVAGSIE